MLKKETIKIIGQVDTAALSHCEKYKLINIEVGEFKSADIIIKPDKLVKSGDSINCYKLISSDYCSSYISLDDFDEWICEEWGKVILDFFFIEEPYNAFDREVYIVKCIDGDKESIAACVDENVAKSLYYSKCIDYAINFDGVHDEFGNMSYVNDDDVNTVRIWLDRFEINRWEEILWEI